MLMPLLRLMRNRAPKLTARTFYAPLLHLTLCRATNLLMGATPKEYGLKRTPPRAGTHRGAAFEHLCAPSA